jgi:hypothetical protein
VRRGVILLLAVLATMGVAKPSSFDGALQSWQNLAAKVATSR